MTYMMKQTPAKRARSVFSTMLMDVPNMSRLCQLRDEHKDEVLSFLAIRPVHTIVMTSFILDNGMESSLNRGNFHGYRNAEGKLEGIAFIGHATLVEARSEVALKALAFAARSSQTPIHLIMSGETAAESFWNCYSDGLKEPRLKCTEQLFEIGFPYPVQDCEFEIRTAKPDELVRIAKAQAEIAFIECGVDPMQKDRDGFLKRVARRIDQDRIFVVYEHGELVFKADIIAETDEAIYLEGIYVAPEYRGRGVGSRCLSKLGLHLLNRVQNICLLSNIEFESAHKSFRKAGFKGTDRCTTIFV